MQVFDFEEREMLTAYNLPTNEKQTITPASL